MSEHQFLCLTPDLKYTLMTPQVAVCEFRSHIFALFYFFFHIVLLLVVVVSVHFYSLKGLLMLRCFPLLPEC